MYSSELVAVRIATEMIIELQNNLQALGQSPIDWPFLIHVWRQFVCGWLLTNTTLPSSTLKKKHNAIAYHCMREGIAAGVLGFVNRIQHCQQADWGSNLLAYTLASSYHHSLH